jgi:flagellar FliL protein
VGGIKGILIMAVVGLLVGLGGTVAVLFGIVPVGPVAEAKALAEKAKPPVTVMYVVKEKVINLADTARPRYLKVQVTLEFIDHKLKAPPKGEEVKKQQEEFAKEMAGYAPIIEDKIGSVISKKSSTELLRPEGKDHLKSELIDSLNAALAPYQGEAASSGKAEASAKHQGDAVVNVYFPAFIVQ